VNPAIEVTAVGLFGEEVARRLATFCTGVRPAGADDGPAPAARVLAAWRPVPALARALDARSRTEGIPFVPVVAEPPLVVVGPVSVPGHSGCYSCYGIRAVQHAARPAEERALQAWYDAHPDSGPHGFLPAIADLAATRVAGLLRRVGRDPLAVAGHVWQVNSLTLRVAAATVVGVHACPLCGLGRDETGRSSASLRRALSWMYEGAQIDHPSTPTAP